MTTREFSLNCLWVCLFFGDENGAEDSCNTEDTAGAIQELVADDNVCKRRRLIGLVKVTYAHDTCYVDNTRTDRASSRSRTSLIAGKKRYLNVLPGNR